MPRKSSSKLASANSEHKQSRPLVAALAVLRRDGPQALTLRAVAAEGGFSNPAIYRHYENKEALIREVIRTTYGVFKAYLFETIDVPGDLERVRAASLQVLQFALDHPHYYQLLFLSPHRLVIDRYPDDFRQRKSWGFRLLVDLVEACIRSGSFGKVDATDTAISLVAHMHGLVIMHQTGRFNDDAELFRRFFVQSMEDQLRAYSPAALKATARKRIRGGANKSAQKK